MDYEDYRDLPKRTVSDKVLHDKAFNITKNLKIHWTSTWTCCNSI